MAVRLKLSADIAKIRIEVQTRPSRITASRVLLERGSEKHVRGVQVAVNLIHSRRANVQCIPGQRVQRTEEEGSPTMEACQKSPVLSGLLYYSPGSALEIPPSLLRMFYQRERHLQKSRPIACSQVIPAPDNMAPLTNLRIPRGQLILVTGANGYISSHVVDALLHEGYRVRGTLRRDMADVKQHFDENHGKGQYETVIVPSMEEDSAFNDAVRGVAGIIHLVRLHGSLPQLMRTSRY